MVIRQKKESIHATVSPYIKRKAEELVETEEFSSMSDLVGIALAEFIGKYNREQKEDTVSEKVTSIISEAIGVGISLVEAGRYEEAKRCFAKVKELEANIDPETSNQIVYDRQKEKEECLKNLCPEPRELTPEGARKAAEAKEYYKTLLGDQEEETVAEQLRKNKVPDKITRRVVIE